MNSCTKYGDRISVPVLYLKIQNRMGELLQSHCVNIRSAKGRAVLRRASHAQEPMVGIDSAATAIAASIA